MTGTIDYLSDGERTYAIKNGHPYLGSITGSGCTLGTTIAAFLAVHKEDRLLAALSGVLMYEIAAEKAAARGMLGSSFEVLRSITSPILDPQSDRESCCGSVKASCGQAILR